MLDLMTTIRTLHAAVGKGAALGELAPPKRRTKAPRRGAKGGRRRG